VGFNGINGTRGIGDIPPEGMPSIRSPQQQPIPIGSSVVSNRNSGEGEGQAPGKMTAREELYYKFKQLAAMPSAAATGPQTSQNTVSANGESSGGSEQANEVNYSTHGRFLLITT